MSFLREACSISTMLTVSRVTHLPDSTSLGLLFESLQEFVVDRLLDQDPTTRATILTGVEPDA